MLTGYEQVRSVVAGLAGDWEEARRVELELSEPGAYAAVSLKESHPPSATEALEALLAAQPTKSSCCSPTSRS